MLVVSDIDDVFLPKPTDLLINLQEGRQALEALLGRLSDMFQDNHTVGSALGPALQAGFQLMVRTKPEETRQLTLLSGSDWWKDRGFDVESSDCWRWRTQKQRGS